MIGFVTYWPTYIEAKLKHIGRFMEFLLYAVSFSFFTVSGIVDKETVNSKLGVLLIFVSGALAVICAYIAWRFRPSKKIGA